MKQIVEFAPAKINLSLQVTGRRDDGYHLLKSLVVFASIGDQVFLEPSSDFSLKITGPFKNYLSATGGDTANNFNTNNYEDNLVIKAARKLQKFLGVDKGAAITLEKNLPVSSGIGGGSADAAAVIRGLVRLWDIGPEKLDSLNNLALELGADVPVCLKGTCSWMEGVGEALKAGPQLPDICCVLINPGCPVSTPQIFRELNGQFSDAVPEPDKVCNLPELLCYLNAAGNDLSKPAERLKPLISESIKALQQQPNCLFAGMSGSGATCFGVYEDSVSAQKAATELKLLNNSWWVKPTILNQDR
ncbi:4-(cytidine 5'-diphospho)-2-C-methyl-D-erythritol kinase [Kiloniella sp. EL199]|uniref:4-(cytidine 5'-diphospho)-2-C-methyl-D-erythritol kinase n=1 Tax=Kiloniella sp. EL199 TaxID=2107581 RepID=UPI000EA274F6|nr:4-(cytidine 5'-diphospho)-2-C-methyl-D-erythritol kinase [Kiloniella sp. EL199]